MQSVVVCVSARWGLKVGVDPGAYWVEALTKHRRDSWKCYKLNSSSIKENGNDLILSTAVNQDIEI